MQLKVKCDMLSNVHDKIKIFVLVVVVVVYLHHNNPEEEVVVVVVHVVHACVALLEHLW